MAKGYKLVAFCLNTKNFYRTKEELEAHLEQNPGHLYTEIAVPNAYFETNPTQTLDWPTILKRGGEFSYLSTSGGELIFYGEGDEENYTTFLPTSGGQLSGPLYLVNDPTVSGEAANKYYVDDTVNTVSGILDSEVEVVTSGLAKATAQVQVDLTMETDLLVVNSGIELNTSSTVLVGEGFTVNSDSIDIHEAGTYKVVWNVCGEMGGSSSGNRRRSLQVELLRNGAEVIQATRGGAYARSVTTGKLASVYGDYLIVTYGNNETVGLRTEDVSSQSTNGITFEVSGGYLRVERVN
jgi:hypothetical protein